jgi:hypothetical protein
MEGKEAMEEAQYKSTPFISEGVVFWDVKMHQVVSNNWILMGVIANTAPAQASYSDSTSYGWAGNISREAHIGGQHTNGHGGWVLGGVANRRRSGVQVGLPSAHPQREAQNTRPWESGELLRQGWLGQQRATRILS